MIISNSTIFLKITSQFRKYKKYTRIAKTTDRPLSISTFIMGGTTFLLDRLLQQEIQKDLL